MENMEDIEKMFAEAAKAAEDTGEKNVGGESTIKQDPPKTKEDTNVKKQEEITRQQDETRRQEELKKQEIQKQEELRKQDELRKQEERQRAESDKKAALAAASNRGLSENSIEKILLMNMTLQKFDERQKAFVSGYFQLEENDAENVSKLIFRALTASQRDLDALSKIVQSKGLDPAERAFFLMSLENMIIEDIYEQLDLLTASLGQAGRVTDSNKLNVCRKIESVISGMQKDVFTYIERLQEFTNIAIAE